MRPAFFAFDTETTGLDPDKNEILSIAMIILNEAFVELERKVIYAFPDGEVNPEAAKVNGYTRELWASRGAVDQTILFTEVYDFVNRYKKLVPVAHNVKFDVAFLRALFLRNNPSKAYNKIFSYKTLDTVSVAIFFDMVVFGKANGSQRLSELCNRFGITLDNAHDALADVEATVNLFRYFFTALNRQTGTKTADIPASSTRSSMLTKNGDNTWRLARGKHKGTTLEELAVTEPGYLRWMLRDMDDLSDEQKQSITEALR